eukprot:4522820-Alexandrium_andersonii.AAC.1
MAGGKPEPNAKITAAPRAAGQREDSQLPEPAYFGRGHRGGWIQLDPWAPPEEQLGAEGRLRAAAKARRALWLQPTFSTL